MDSRTQPTGGSRKAPPGLARRALKKSNPCTTEKCNADNTCGSENVPAGQGTCTDNNPCISYGGVEGGADACDGNGGCEGKAVDCSAKADACDYGVCNTDGVCVADPKPEGERCHGGYCDGRGGCKECLGDGHCPEGRRCRPRDGVCVECLEDGDCEDDGNPCTTESCNLDTNTCGSENVPAGEGTCTDNNPCTSFDGTVGGTDACDGAGRCLGTPITCSDDGNPCTVDTCVAGYCNTPGNGGTVCRQAEGDCDVVERCTGSSSECPPDGFKDRGVACGDDFDGPCTDPDTCDGSGNCQPNNTPCGYVTSSSLCPFDSCPDDEGNQFRLLFTPDVQNWPAYKLNASNPGQFYYNLVVNGNPGDDVTVSINIPYPFVTHGAMPIHVYDAAELEFGAGGCFLPPDDALAAYPDQLSMADWTGGSCGPICGPNGVGTCTLDVSATYPDSGSLYITVHLDYGLKGVNTDANPCGGGSDRYDRGAGPSMCGGYNATVNTTDGTGPVAISNGRAYEFSHVGGGGTNDDEDTVWSVNVFKPIKGAFGSLVDSLTGEPAGQGAMVTLVRNSTGAVVKQATIDEDGFYGLDYQHKGKTESYTVRILGTLNVSRVVGLRGSGWAEVNYDPATDAWSVTQANGTK